MRYISYLAKLIGKNTSLSNVQKYCYSNFLEISPMFLNIFDQNSVICKRLEHPKLIPPI